MSSPDSPVLDLKLEQRRTERCVLGGIAALMVVIPWTVSTWRPFSAALISLLALAGLLLFLLRAGKPLRISWLADGSWRWYDSDDEFSVVRLLPASRSIGGLIWLKFCGSHRRALLLGPMDLNPAELRRLKVRLRLEGLNREANGSVYHEPV